MSSIWVKVCGLTRPADVVAAIEAGADAIGLVLVERSPRRLDPQRASELAAVAKGRATIVLLVEESPDAAVSLARRVGADSIQPYGPHAHAAAEAAIEAGLQVLFPVGVDSHGDLNLADLPDGVVPLLDTAVDGVSGGTGRTFDWSRAAGVSDAVIAGGLNADNVSAAITAARPHGVDASSGLEADVGIKDDSKVTAFVAAARAAANGR